MKEASPDDSDAQRRLNDIGQLASSTGHHVINAFAAIVSQAELLRMMEVANSPISIQPDRLADSIIRTALDASNVARRMIDYSRLATAFQPEPVVLDRLIRELVEQRRAQAPAGVAFKLELAPVPTINGSRPQLRAMLDLMIDNAIEALPSGQGTITLSTTRDERGWVTLEVRDTGAGMTSTEQERAVEPFFTTKAGRLGVGLSIAHGIWRRHRGTIALQSVPGQGTVLRLRIEPRNHD